MGNEVISHPDTPQEEVGKNELRLNDVKRFQNAENFGAIHMGQLFYDIKERMIGKKSSKEVFDDTTIFDRDTILKDIVTYLEGEWTTDGKSVPPEYSERIQSLAKKLLSGLEQRIKMELDEKKTEQDIRKRMGKLIEDSSFFPG